MAKKSSRPSGPNKQVAPARPGIAAPQKLGLQIGLAIKPKRG